MKHEQRILQKNVENCIVGSTVYCTFMQRSMENYKFSTVSSIEGKLIWYMTYILLCRTFEAKIYLIWLVVAVVMFLRSVEQGECSVGFLLR
jgi:hypothetical protein